MPLSSTRPPPDKTTTSPSPEAWVGERLAPDVQAIALAEIDLVVARAGGEHVPDTLPCDWLCVIAVTPREEVAAWRESCGKTSDHTPREFVEPFAMSLGMTWQVHLRRLDRRPHGQPA
jgi:hypothetical protein